MTDLISRPWPWYVAGPLIGLMIPLLLKLGSKPFGISSSLRHLCAACLPGDILFFRYDWRRETWLLVFAGGILLGGILGGTVFGNPEPIKLSAAALADLQRFGIGTTGGLHPDTLFNFAALGTVRGFILIVVGGFLVGFGTRYANGCTSGHSIMGLANLQWPSLVATCSFFAGGLLVTWFVLPAVLAL